MHFDLFKEQQQSKKTEFFRGYRVAESLSGFQAG
jgi:hypothetical protein